MGDKKLYRADEGRLIWGICKGISEVYGIDVSLVRIITVALSLVSFIGVILYLVAGFIIPRKCDLMSSTDVIDMEEKDEDVTENGQE